MDASVPHFQDAQIGDSGLAFMVGPKPDMPSICTTATSYTFTHEYTSNSTNNKITAHSQVELTDSMFNPDDIVLFAKLTYDAYERKFDVSSKATQVYFDMSLNLHAIYTKSTEDFRKVTVLHFQKGTVATIMGNDMACFRVSGEDDRFVLILEPRTYHKNYLAALEYISFMKWCILQALPSMGISMQNMKTKSFGTSTTTNVAYKPLL